MPLRGSGHSALVKDEAPYFKSLAELDSWADAHPAKLAGVLPYTPRPGTSDNRGRLLVCHDYKGGYTESPSAPSYTFNFWPFCDVFIYFSHHRVTVPPSGWTNAAHRHGTKMLGTLIFEHVDSAADCLRLLVGRLPQSVTGPARSSSSHSFPTSPHYARILADLARQRGFDGYLLNFEYKLDGAYEQTRALTAWIGILERELKHAVGSHAEVIWYDSVIVNGQLRWQDRLNSVNLPFFIPSTGFFINYTWPPTYPSLTAQYFLSLEPNHVSTPHPKSLRDVFVGVDVWGRGSHGGGGFASYKAISHIDPEFLGLSVALFGPGWTWESEQDKPGWTWDAWWQYERTLWLGPEKSGQLVKVPDPPENQPPCPHGPFVPITSFFPRRPPPDPAEHTFHTSFSPGVGWSWFVNGLKVLEAKNGWTDVDKNCSLGDMVWPRPTLSWENGDREEAVPAVASSLCMDDAWLGGSSLRLSFSMPGSDAEDAFFRCLWVPVQSLAITSSRSYEMTVVYKIETDSAVELDVGLGVKSLTDDALTSVEVRPLEYVGKGGGWTKQSIQFSLQSNTQLSVSSAAGLIIGFAMEDPTEASHFSVLLGSLTVAPSPPAPSLSAGEPRLVWADFQPSTPRTTGAVGNLTWGTAITFAPLTAISIVSPEDPQPAWMLDASSSSSSSFLYFNVYAQAASPTLSFAPEHSDFIGTTGLDGRANRFYVDAACLPEGAVNTSHLRFYIQGVTDRGEVLPWERCVYVDVKPR